MTENERLILLNQFEILSHLKTDDPYFAVCRDILENGYEVLYYEVTKRLGEPMSADEGQFVIDVLQMHRTLIFSYNDLQDKKELTERDVAFVGFDGSEEGKHYAFAVYYIEDFSRFHELIENDINSYNSHSKMIPKYKRMLEVWNNTTERNNVNLTVEEIKAILEA